MLKPVRDIRDDLNDRLASVREERAQLTEKLSQLEEQEGLYRRALEIEEKRFQDALPLDDPSRHPPDAFANFVLTILKNRSRTKEEIKEMAIQAKLLSEDEAPGRTVHATLVNLTRRNRILAGRDERYHLVPE